MVLSRNAERCMATMGVTRWMQQDPYPASVTYSPAPLWFTPFPTDAPMVVHGNELNQAQTAFMSVVVLFVMTVILLIVVLYLHCLNQRAATALPGEDIAGNSQQTNLVRNMSPEDRKAYVTNFLKTQKFEEAEISAATKRNQVHFRQPSPSPVHIINPKEEVVEANLSVRSSLYPSCAICLDHFAHGEDVCSAQNAQCPHEFHLTCIFPWLLKSQECPCCRRDYLSVDEVAMERYLKESASQNLSSSMHSI